MKQLQRKMIFSRGRRACFTGMKEERMQAQQQLYGTSYSLVRNTPIGPLKAHLSALEARVTSVCSFCAHSFQAQYTDSVHKSQRPTQEFCCRNTRKMTVSFSHGSAAASPLSSPTMLQETRHIPPFPDAKFFFRETSVRETTERTSAFSWPGCPCFHVLESVLPCEKTRRTSVHLGKTCWSQM